MATYVELCSFCNDLHYWEDTVNNQTLICPFCTVPDYTIIEDKSGWRQEYWYKMEVVIHSGATTDNVAEFFQKTGYVKYKDRKVKVSAHINWSKTYDKFVQSVSFTNVAWHVGGSRFNGHRRLNFQSIGMELPGPWDKKRDQQELDLVRESVVCIMECVPMITTVVRHSDIDSRKKDPGPGFTWDCLDGLGLIIGE
jgi:N-acetyl-anhydromuramyl-L-alanine amidase AmpD